MVFDEYTHKKTSAHAKVFSCYSVLFFFGNCLVIVFFDDAAEFFAAGGAKKIFGVEFAIKANSLAARGAYDFAVIVVFI